MLTAATALALVLMVGCSDEDGGPTPADAGQDTDASDTGPGLADATSGDTGTQEDVGLDGGDAGASGADTDSDTGSPDGGVPLVVINEIQATGDDWLELYNAGNATADLSDWYVTDDQSGSPDVSHRLYFESGFELAPGEYALVIGDGTHPDFEEDCASGALGKCVVAMFRINAGNDTLYVVDGGDEYVDVAYLPTDAVPRGSSYGRIPNGTGDFTETRPTPGAANEAP